MSLGYAQKLSYKEDVGDVGMSEIFDPPHLLQQKIEELAAIIKESRHLVAFTGAGISTSCGIPDFRGPKGIWTLQHEGKALPEASLPFDRAMPSSTHMALVELEKIGILKFVISQNVDSLHLRSGIPREKLAELHGNSFREICPSCKAEYVRDFEVETIGLKETPRRCSKVTCGAKLRDTVLDWEDELPPKEMNAAAKHCKMADVVLCLGTSLQITPACNLPSKCLRGGGRIAIVNLQSTPKDKKACLVIHGLVDKVVASVMQLLSLQIPPFIRIDFFQVIFNGLNCMQDKGTSKWSIRLASVHDEKAPLPFMKSVEISFPESSELEVVTLQMQPFSLMRAMLLTGPLKILLKINFSEGCRCQFASIDLSVNFQEPSDSVSQAKDIILQKLKDLAVQSDSCGQFSVIERKVASYKKQEISTYAIATNIVRYSGLESTVKLAAVDLDDNEGAKANLKSNSFCVTSCKGEENLKKSRVS